MAPKLDGYPYLSLSSITQYQLSGLLGLLSHVFYFIHGRKHARSSVPILLVYAFSGALTLALSIYVFGVSAGIAHFCLVTSSYFGALFTSILVYRLFFHRTRHFPGPIMAKVTKLYSGYLNRDRKMHEAHMRLAEKYGDFVRIGPNEIMVRNVEAIPLIHGAQSKCLKGPLYDNIVFKDVPFITGIPHREPHRWRRQVWDRALGTKNFYNYEVCAQATAQDWLRKLREITKGGQAVNTSLFSLLIAFDNMGRAGFSREWGVIQAGKENRLLDLLEWLFFQMAAMGHSLNWPVPIAKLFNTDTREKEFQDLVKSSTTERLGRTDDPEDIMKYFIQDFQAKEPKAFFDRSIVDADAGTILIGATDTVGSTLAFLFYYLAKQPHLRDQLRQELRPLAEKSPEFPHTDLAKIGLLDAIINETLRMYPAGWSIGSRMTPPEGITIAGTFIPGEVELYSPIGSYHRDERYFKHANEYIAERWTTRPELVLDRRAFHPFLTGPYNCVGRNYAMMFLRITVAHTVWNFDFEFAPGEEGKAIFDQLVNQILLCAGPLHLRFTPLK